MKSPTRLYLTADKRRVVKHGHPGATFLLCSEGQEIKEIYLPLVQSCLSEPSQKDEPIKAEPAPEKDESEAASFADDSEPFAERDTRVITSVRKRGRPKKFDG